MARNVAKTAGSEERRREILELAAHYERRAREQAVLEKTEAVSLGTPTDAKD